MKTTYRKFFWTFEQKERWLNEMSQKGLHVAAARVLGRYDFVEDPDSRHVYTVDSRSAHDSTQEIWRLLRTHGWLQLSAGRFCFSVRKHGDVLGERARTQYEREHFSGVARVFAVQLLIGSYLVAMQLMQLVNLHSFLAAADNPVLISPQGLYSEPSAGIGGGSPIIWICVAAFFFSVAILILLHAASNFLIALRGQAAASCRLRALFAMKTCWKFFWTFEQKERWLNEMSQKGLRVAAARFFGCYDFVESFGEPYVYNLEYFPLIRIGDGQTLFRVFLREHGWRYVPMPGEYSLSVRVGAPDLAVQARYGRKHYLGLAKAFLPRVLFVVLLVFGDIVRSGQIASALQTSYEWHFVPSAVSCLVAVFCAHAVSNLVLALRGLWVCRQGRPERLTQEPRLY
jgi:hypothetical protein